MRGEVREQLVHLLSATLAWALTHLLVEKYLKEEEDRGIGGDVKEALLKAGATMTATLASSFLVRRLL